MRKPILFIFFLIPTIISGYDSLWMKTYGGSGIDEASSIKLTQDSGFIVTGCKADSFWLLKLDRYGDTIWTRTYPGNISSQGFDIICLDSGYAILGSKDNYAWLLITDENGDTIWTKSYTFANSPSHKSSIIQFSNHSFLLTGYNYDYQIMLTDSLGDSIWMTNWQHSWDVTCKCYDENFISAMGSDEVYVRKYTINRDSIWSTWFMFSGGCWGDAYPHYIKETCDSGFIISGGYNGYHGPINAFFLKADSTGNLIFQVTLYEPKYDTEIGLSAVECLDGSYFVSVSNNRTSEIGLWKISNIGDSLWYRTYGQGYGWDLEAAHDSACVLVGRLNDDLFIMKFDSIGNTGVDEPVFTNPVFSEPIFYYDQTQKLFFLTLTSDLEISLKIYDIQGRLVETPVSGIFQKGIHQIQFTPERSGIYFYKLEADEFTQTGKFTVLR